MKNTPNHHYNGTFLEPWGERSQRGYGIEILAALLRGSRDASSSAALPRAARNDFWQPRSLTYNDLAADRNSVAIVQAMEAILARHAAGEPGATAEVNGLEGGLVLLPRRGRPEVLYAGTV